MVSGLFIFVGLHVARNDRDAAYRKAQESKTIITALQQAQAPWPFPEAKKQEFIAHLQDAPKGRVAIEYIRSDEVRSRDFAVRIRDILKECGYEVWGYMPAFEQADAPPLVGVQIIVKNRQAEIVGGGLQRAFQAIGIDAKDAHRTNNNYEDDFVVVWIGMKPPQ